MAALIDHLAQAEHNVELAAKLNTDAGLKYRDWLITVAFYAAVHYAEAVFATIDEIGHTEQSCPDTNRHAWRAEAIHRHFSRNCYTSYRKLMNASYNVRYLKYPERTGLASKYYSRDAARKMFREDLRNVREEVERQGIKL